MTTEETLSMHANRITRGASIMRQPFEPWERLKALEDVEASMVSAKRLLLSMHAAENVGQKYGPEIRRNDEIGRVGL